MRDKSRPAAADRPPLLAFTPVPRQCKRHDGWTPARQRRFVDALAETGSVASAARAVNMTPEGAYLLRRHPDAASLREAWDHALSLGVQRLHDIAMERVLHGVPYAVFYKGEQCGERRLFGDRLLVQMLKHHANGYARSPVGRRSRETIELEAAENCPVCRDRREAEAAAAAAPPEDEAAFVADLFRRYQLKVKLERHHRLAGDVVAADFTLRQLTWLEGVLDRLGESERVTAWWTETAGQGFDPIEPSEIGHALAALREQVWAAADDPPRPRPGPMAADSGRHGGPTGEERENAQIIARRRIAAAQREWEAAATEESWAVWKAAVGR